MAARTRRPKPNARDFHLHVARVLPRRDLLALVTLALLQQESKPSSKDVQHLLQLRPLTFHSLQLVVAIDFAALRDMQVVLL